jgi:TctA family transporter
MLEDHFRRSMIISHGDPLVFFKTPLSASLMALAALLLVVLFVPMMRKKRDVAFAED